MRQFADPPVLDGALEVLLELADSQITYRQRYVMVAARAPVVDLVVLDPNNPRSVAYQLDKIEAHQAYAKTYYFGSLLTEKYPHLRKQLSAAE